MADWLTVGEVARLLRVSPSRVAQLLREGACSFVRVGLRGMRLVPREAAEELARRRAQTAARARRKPARRAREGCGVP